MRALVVLKGFTEGGKFYAPGEPAPTGLNPATIELLVRTRHLHDPKAKHSARVVNVLQVSENREEVSITTGADGRYHRVGISERLGTPAVGDVVAHPVGDPLAGRKLAHAQDWDAPREKG